MEDKVRENRLRRVAQRRGLRLVKSRRRDPRAIDYGGFMLIRDNNTVVQDIPIGDRYPPGSCLNTLDEIEAYLNR
jgi:hypothetical protein